MKSTIVQSCKKGDPINSTKKYIQKTKLWSERL